MPHKIVAVYFWRMNLSLSLTTYIEWQDIVDLPFFNRHGIFFYGSVFRFVQAVKGAHGDKSAHIICIIHNIARNPAQNRRRTVNE